MLLACVAGLAGCVSVAEERTRQLDEIGDVELAVVVCASTNDPQSSCPLVVGEQPAGAGEYQLLVGVRSLTSATAPEAVTASDGSLALNASPSFTTELGRLAPPTAGQRWTGYLSPPFEYDPAVGPPQIELLARFGLARGADGSPFNGPFRHRTVVGYREAAPDPNRPVECGESLIAGTADTVCQDYPESEPERDTDIETPVRDLGVLSGGAGQAGRGGTGTVPFSLIWSGGSAGPAVAIAATTTVPGGTAAPAQTSFTPPGPGTHGIPVTVAVPPGAFAGDYDVTLTARIGNQTRQASARLTVLAPAQDTEAPEITAAPKGKLDLATVLRRGLLVDAGCDEPCRISADLRLGRASARALRIPLKRGAKSVVVGRTQERTAADGIRSVRIHFAKALKPRLKRSRRLALSLRVAARDTSGNARARTLRVALAR